MWKILVVDDDFMNRKLIIALLDGRAKCDAAASGKEALEAYFQSVEKKSPYDVILLDVAMPEMDGVETLQKIRTFEETNKNQIEHPIPIIMVTAHSTAFMKSIKQGADDFILKPIDGEKLIQKIAGKIPPTTKTPG